jgi:ankyrin repeat protein
MQHIDVNSGGSASATAMFSTLTSGSAECLNMLLKDERTDIDQHDKKKRNVFSFACEMGQAALVQAFIAHGRVDMNSCDADDMTPLMWAVIARQEAVVDILLERGGAFDMKLQDNQHRNAIALAAWKSTPEFMEKLLNVGPECAFHKHEDGYAPFEWSLDHPEKPDNAKVFLRMFPKEFEGVAGLSMFKYALSWGAVKIAQLLSRSMHSMLMCR